MVAISSIRRFILTLSPAESCFQTDVFSIRHTGLDPPEHVILAPTGPRIPARGATPGTGNERPMRSLGTRYWGCSAHLRRPRMCVIPSERGDRWHCNRGLSEADFSMASSNCGPGLLSHLNRTPAPKEMSALARKSVCLSQPILKMAFGFDLKPATVYAEEQ